MNQYQIIEYVIDPCFASIDVLFFGKEMAFIPTFMTTGEISRFFSNQKAMRRKDREEFLVMNQLVIVEKVDHFHLNRIANSEMISSLHSVYPSSALVSSDPSFPVCPDLKLISKD